MLSIHRSEAEADVVPAFDSIPEQTIPIASEDLERLNAIYHRYDSILAEIDQLNADIEQTLATEVGLKASRESMTESPNLPSESV